MQILPCQGQSCYTVGVANYTAGCNAIGGFISGAADSVGAQSFCTVPGGVTQVQACPAGTAVCAPAADFADVCVSKLGGFIDGYYGTHSRHMSLVALILTVCCVCVLCVCVCIRICGCPLADCIFFLRSKVLRRLSRNAQSLEPRVGFGHAMGPPRAALTALRTSRLRVVSSCCILISP